MPSASHLRAGAWAEDQAVRHLAANGLELVDRNFRCRLGEIDLIMRDGRMLVFVEVRLRHSDRFGGAFASVTRAKQRKLAAAARAYLARCPADTACRFDVVSVAKRNYRPEIHWLKDAFGHS